jgi:hypothetical protein
VRRERAFEESTGWASVRPALPLDDDQVALIARLRLARVVCPICRDRITNNALGRAAHIRWCTKEKAAAKVEAERRARNPKP